MGMTVATAPPPWTTSRTSESSASLHSYFGGDTHLYGTVVVRGAEDDALDSLVLEVVQGGGAVATVIPKELHHG